MIRILLADDQRLLCDGLQAMLETNPEYRVVGVALDGVEAVEMAGRLLPDLLLLDIRMPRLDGVSAVKEIKHAHPQMRIVLLTTFHDEQYVLDAMAHGADGYLLKDMEAADLLHAVGQTLRGHMVLPPVVADTLKQGLTRIQQRNQGLKQLRQMAITAREMEVAQMLADGFTNAQIAKGLYLSEGTVRNYVSVLYDKLGVEDRAGAMRTLQRLGL